MLELCYHYWGIVKRGTVILVKQIVCLVLPNVYNVMYIVLCAILNVIVFVSVIVLLHSYLILCGVRNGSEASGEYKKRNENKVNIRNGSEI